MSYSVSTRASRPQNSPLTCPEPDGSYFYAVCRALSFFPTINGNSAFFEEQALAPLIGTDKGFTFTLANVSHSVGPGKPNQVIGTVRQEAVVPGEGVDLLVQLDRRACENYEIIAEDLLGGDLSNVSIEILCDRENSQLVAFTNPQSKSLADQKVFTAEEAASLGIQRTAWSSPDPYLYEDKYVVAENCKPIRCRGIAFVGVPADKTANVYEVAASLEESAAKDYLTKGSDYADPGFREDKKKRYPLDEKHIHAAIDFWGRPENRDKYTPEQQKHIQAKIDAAKKKFGIGDEEKSGFSSDDIPSVTPMSSYYDVEPLDIDAAQHPDMPDQAFADTHFDPEEDCDKRAYPLYASAKHFVESKPHPGLVKAALNAHADGKIHNPQTALQRLQVAHSQLHGAKSMDDKEQLATELAAMKAKLAEVQASLEGKDTVVSEKDTEIASLKAQIATLTEESASLKDGIAKRDAEEKAGKRLAELTKIEGFAVSDEEKASLLESLKSEDEVAFENRVLKAKITSMEEAAKKKPAKKEMSDEEKAAQRNSEEIAALRGLDIFPVHNVGAEKVDIYALI